MSDQKIAIFTSLNDNLVKFENLCEFTKAMLKTFFETQKDYKYDYYMCIVDGQFAKWKINLYPYSRYIKFIKGHCPDDLDENLKPWWNKIFTSVELLKNYDIVIHIDYDTIVFNSFKERIDEFNNSKCDTCCDKFSFIENNNIINGCDTSLIMFNKQILKKFKYLQSEYKDYLRKCNGYESEEFFLGKKDLKNYNLGRVNFNNIDFEKLTYSELHDTYKKELLYHFSNSYILCNSNIFMHRLKNDMWTIKNVLNAYFLMKEYFPKEFLTNIFNDKLQIIKTHKLHKYKSLHFNTENRNDLICKYLTEVLLKELNKLEHIV